MASMPIRAALLTSAAFTAALDAADAARDHFNGLPEELETTDRVQHEAEMTALCDATRRGDEALPTTWHEYTRLIEHMSDSGLSAIDDDNAKRLLDHARRLSASPQAGALAALFAACDEAEAHVDCHQREVLDSAAHADKPQGERNREIADNNALNDVWCDALLAVAHYPATSVDELQAKLAYMAKHRIAEDQNWVPTILADVERIAVQSTTPEWDAALSDFEEKAAAFGAAMTAHDETASRLFADRTPENDKAYDEAEKATDDRCAESCEAVRVLIATPAPNAPAAMKKAQIALDSGQLPGTGLAEILRADLRRFTNYANQEA